VLAVLAVFVGAAFLKPPRVKNSGAVMLLLVLNDPQAAHAAAASHSLMERRSSNVAPQSAQWYS
jgi:hypothetical protein